MRKYIEVLGNVVRNARSGLEMTQSEVADCIDVDVRTILNIENHKGNPKLEVLYPLIRALNIDPSTIFYPEMDRNREGVVKMNVLLSRCSDQEIQALLKICETVITVMRAENAIQIDDK